VKKADDNHTRDDGMEWVGCQGAYRPRPTASKTKRMQQTAAFCSANTVEATQWPIDSQWL